MKFNWRRTIAPILLVAGLLLCISENAMIGLGVFLVGFGLRDGLQTGVCRRLQTFFAHRWWSGEGWKRKRTMTTTADSVQNWAKRLPTRV